jgi:uncharacterized damage-inducible protein DinB
VLRALLADRKAPDDALKANNGAVNAALAELFRYNRWANLRLIDACRELTAEQLDARGPGTSGSIRELLMHVVGGQQTSILRTKGRQHEGELARGSAWPGFGVLRGIAVSTSEELIRIAEAMEMDLDVDLTWRGKVHRYPMRLFLVEAVEHGVEHRTEIKVTMAGLDVERPDLDSWFYSDAAGYGQEVR